MNVTKSEEIFENYLKEHQIKFTRDYPVGKGNVDFYISADTGNILSDVKEIQNSKKLELDAYDYIREDLKKLRQKFKTKPSEPVLLVTFNNSSRFFTGFTVARAMFGDMGVTLDEKKDINSDIHFLDKGNASLTRIKNCSISGVFVLQENSKNYLFLNPYADNRFKTDIFPNTTIIELNRQMQGESLINLNKIMFWNS